MQKVSWVEYKVEHYFRSNRARLVSSFPISPSKVTSTQNYVLDCTFLSILHNTISSLTQVHFAVIQLGISPRFTGFCSPLFVALRFSRFFSQSPLHQGLAAISYASKISSFFDFSARKIEQIIESNNQKWNVDFLQVFFKNTYQNQSML